MKRNILQTFVLLSALALASCSTTNKIASTQTADDDVYFTKAEAGDAPVYRQPVNEDRYIATNGEEGDDEDYYYYDSYASRINRFGYNSPFDYYDDYYYGYNNPYAYGGYGGGLGYGGLGYGYGGWNIGLGFGYGGYGYGAFGNPWGYGYGGGYGFGGYGYGLGGYYSPYSYWGTGYGYGGGGYWGVVSANNVSRARPYRGAGFPNSTIGGGRTSSARPVGYNGNYPNAMSYPGRRPSASGAINGNYGGARPTRGSATNSQPVYRPTRSEASRPAPQPTFDRGSQSSSAGSSNSGGGGGGSRGGGRPGRP